MTREEVDWTDADEAAAFLAEVAVKLASAIRVKGPHAVLNLVQEEVPDRCRDWLLTVMAAMIPAGVIAKQLLAWQVNAYNGDETAYEPMHKAYQELRLQGRTTAEIPRSVVLGEQLWEKATAGRDGAAVAS